MRVWGRAPDALVWEVGGREFRGGVAPAVARGGTFARLRVEAGDGLEASTASASDTA
jgi:hypothetical protein